VLQARLTLPKAKLACKTYEEAPFVKQYLAALRGLFNWLVIKQLVSENPARSGQQRVAAQPLAEPRHL